MPESPGIEVLFQLSTKDRSPLLFESSSWHFVVRLAHRFVKVPLTDLSRSVDPAGLPARPAKTPC